MEKLVKFNLGGHTFILSAHDLKRGPASRLTEMFTDADLGEQFVNRPAEYFAAIVALYQTGELHIPMNACPGAFQTELAYWGIPLDTLTSCCRNRLSAFIEEQETLERFYAATQPLTYPSRETSEKCSLLLRCRQQIWSVVDFTQLSKLAKMYFFLTLVMVLVSLFTLAFSTDPSFQRTMTNCERLEYMAASGMDNYKLAQKALENVCDASQIPYSVKNLQADISFPYPGIRPEGFEHDQYIDIYIPFNGSYAELFYKEDIARTTVPLVELPTPFSMVGSRTTATLIIPMISTSVANTTDASARSLTSANPFHSSSTVNSQPLNSFEERKATVSGKFIRIPNMKVKIYSLEVLNIVTIVFFTVDFVLRMLSCPSYRRYFLSIINLADTLALIGMYLNLLVLNIRKEERYNQNWMDLLEYTQMFRAFRLFRIASTLKAGRILAYTVKTNYKDLIVMVTFLVAGMCTYASVLFIAESKKNIKSIPDAWYWAVVTMTTVGYGDIVPKSDLGKFIGCLCALTGVLLFALTVPTFANNFLMLYQFADNRLSLTGEQKSWNVPTDDTGQGYMKEEQFRKMSKQQRSGVNVPI